MSDESTGSEVVYGHGMSTEAGYFHIGSGSERRARDLRGRGTPWRDYVGARGGPENVVVGILECHHCPARARLREMELVAEHQPHTNTFGRESIPAGIRDGRLKGSKLRCGCGAPDCYGAEVTARTGRTSVGSGAPS